MNARVVIPSTSSFHGREEELLVPQNGYVDQFYSMTQDILGTISGEVPSAAFSPTSFGQKVEAPVFEIQKVDNGDNPCEADGSRNDETGQYDLPSSMFASADEGSFPDDLVDFH